MAKTPRVQQILNLPIVDVNKMTAAELRANVQILASAANKRLARLGSTEIGRIAPAYLSAAKRSFTGAAGGKFGTAGKNRNQLLNEFKAAKSFLEMKTSSVTGWKSVRNKGFERAGLSPRKIKEDAQKEKRIYSLLRRILELRPDLVKKPEGYGSKNVESDLRKVVYNSTHANNIISDINDYNLRNRKTVLDENDNIQDITDIGDNVVVDKDGKQWQIDFNDPEDVLRVLEMKADMEYEREQYSAEDDEFFEL